jgi:phosphohistidine swiveling domain-containing protein
MRLQPDGASPQAGLERLAADRERAVAELKEKLPDDEARGQLDAGLRAARVLLAARERSKTTLIMLVHEARLALQELGRRMLDAGHFRTSADFTLLRLDEFPPFIDDPASYAAEVADRRAWFDEIAALEPPFITDGEPAPPSTWRRRTVEDLPPVVAGEVLQGIGSCAGTATGRARVIHDPEDADDLEPGDVLVAAQTDPSWTPLFLGATAVIVDVGAPMSHASIVSRELGIPCVVSAQHASRRIPDGALVTVDGANGVITVQSL